jgi:NADH-quinone oxidoreductase subunit L
VFFGKNRGGNGGEAGHGHAAASHEPHESPMTMTVPLMILAACAILLGFLGTPAWPWFQSFLGQHHEGGGFSSAVVSLMVISSLVVFAGIGLGWWFYGRKSMEKADAPDPLERLPGDIYQLFRNKYWVDEAYEASVIRLNAWSAWACDFLDKWIWGGVVQLVSLIVLGFSWLNRFVDEYVVNLGFDASCRRISAGGKIMSRLQDGRVQHYLRVIGVALAVLVLIFIWGCQGK